MADVTTNANGTTERNGSVVTTCLPTGVYKTDNDGDQGDGKTPDHSRDVAGLDVASLETKLTNRFDDPTYYSA